VVRVLFSLVRGTAVITTNPAENEGTRVKDATPAGVTSANDGAATPSEDEGGALGEDTVLAANPAEAEGQQTTGGNTPTPRERSSGDQASEEASMCQEEQYQQAYLLQQLKDAPGGKLPKGKANRFPRGVTRELNLTPTVANELRERLVEIGYARTEKKGGSVNYELTPEGEAYLATLEQKPLPDATRPPEGPVSEEARRYRRTFLLFQLFEAEGQTLDQKAINRFREPGRKFLDLKAPAANQLRQHLVDEALIEEVQHGRNTFFRLTPAGREHLGGTAHFPAVELMINGNVLNELLEAAREAARQFEGFGIEGDGREPSRAVHEPDEAVEEVR
jgi:predicted transcriptional regulator